jgi:hypothetical protein
MQVRLAVAVAVAVAAVMLTGCGGTSIQPAVAQQTATKPSCFLDCIHQVDWQNVTVPGSTCGSKRPIKLRDGQATVARSTLEPKGGPVHVGADLRPVYGDLDQDGPDEAALRIICLNPGSTASGQLAFSAVIFKGRPGSLRVLGVLTPQVHKYSGYHVPLLLVADMEGNTIIALEFVYREQDSTCCPWGRAVTLWTYAHGKLRPTETTQLR